MEKLTRWGLSRKAGKKDAHHPKGSSIRTLGFQKINDEETDDMIELLKNMKIKKAGKYSAHHKPSKASCLRCNSSHPPERCAANSKTCFETRAKKNWNIHQEDQKSTTTRRIVTLKKITYPANKWIDAKIGGKWQQLYADTDTKFTIISPDDFDPFMGTLQPTNVQFRAWGASENLHVVGIFETTIENANGTSLGSMVYVVVGYQPEHLMGDRDSEELVFTTFNTAEKKPTKEGTLNRIPQKLRENLNVKVATQHDELKLDLRETDQLKELLNSYQFNHLLETFPSITNLS